MSDRDGEIESEGEDHTSPVVAQPNPLPGLLREWLSREEELKSLTAAVKEHRTRIKILKGLITNIMKSGNTGKLDIPARGVVLIQPEKPKKSPINKKYLLSALTEYFKGDGEMASMCVHFLESHRPMKGGGEKLVFDPSLRSTSGSVAGSVAGGSVIAGSIRQ